jgi:transcription initiation factor TFIIE subunit alpha
MTTDNMKLSTKQVEDVVVQVSGEDVLNLVRVLKDKKNVSEFKLAESIKQEVNATRNMLYRLYDFNLVSFTRKKDKKKGWYIYYWTFDIKRVKYLISVLKKKKLEKLKERLGREKSSTFYACEDKCIRLDFDQAVNFEFKCPECGKLIDVEKNEEIMAELKKEIGEIEKELKQENKV